MNKILLTLVFSITLIGSNVATIKAAEKKEENSQTANEAGMIDSKDLQGVWQVTSVEKDRTPTLTNMTINFEFLDRDNIKMVYIKPSSQTMSLPSIPGVVTINTKAKTLKIMPKTDELPPILEPTLQAMGAPFLTKSTTFDIVFYKPNKILTLETKIEDLNSQEAIITIIIKKL